MMEVPPAAVDVRARAESTAVAEAGAVVGAVAAGAAAVAEAGGGVGSGGAAVSAASVAVAQAARPEPAGPVAPRETAGFQMPAPAVRTTFLAVRARCPGRPAITAARPA